MNALQGITIGAYDKDGNDVLEYYPTVMSLLERIQYRYARSTSWFSDIVGISVQFPDLLFFVMVCHTHTPIRFVYVMDTYNNYTFVLILKIYTCIRADQHNRSY